MEMESIDQAYTPKVTLRVVLPNKHAGALIGIKGNIAHNIEKKYSVKIHATPIIGRLVNITGSTQNVASAWKMCLIHLSNGFPIQYTKNAVLNFLLPVDLVALLKDQLEINLNFEYMARSTGITIKLKKGTLPRCTENVLQVVIPDLDHLGPFEQLVYLLADVTRMHPHLSMSPETKYYIPNATDEDFINSMEDDIVYN